MRNKKGLILIGLGSINLLHAGLHILQFIQSIFLVASSATKCDDEGLFNSILHNPIFNIVWAIVGLLTLYVGIKDFRHHKNCEEHEH